MEFTCLVVMQLYLSFWGLAAVTAWGNHCSEASLEDRAASKGVRPGSASRSPNSIPGMNTMVSQKVIPGRSCGAAQAKPVKTRLYTAMVILAITCERMPHIRTVTDLHKAVQEQARDNFNSADAGLNDSDVAGWAVVARAGGRWHELSVNETWGRQALPAPSGKRCFFLHVGALADAFDGCGQHLVIPITDDTSDWRAAALQRVRAAHPSLMPLLMRLRCTLNGKELGAVCRSDDLADATLRWGVPGLLGGAPKAQDDVRLQDVDTMHKDDLMSYAKNILDVEIRQTDSDGTKTKKSGR